MNPDPRDIINRSPMSWLQIVAVVITIGLNALDGFDVLSISFASPGIAREWGIDRAALGIVLSMELIGMAIGSLALGGVADKVGRRPTMLGCLVVMSLGMYMASLTASIGDLRLWRLITGLGIGGMLATINAVAAEYSSLRRRNLCVSLMAIGYPIGAVLGGMIVAQLLKGDDWRSVFHFGALITVAFIPLVALLVPESVSWLCLKQPRGALQRVNRALARMGHAAVTALPAPAGPAAARSIADILRPGLVGTTLLITLAYFLHITTFYYILKWVPKIVVDMGFAPSAAAGVLVWANVGGAVGGAILGLLTRRVALKTLTIGALVISTVMVNIFGHGQADLQQLAVICAATGFFTNAGVVGLYALFAQVFPTHVRATGTGFAIGFGRGGSALAPMIAGFLFQAGHSLQAVSLFISVGSLLAASALMLLRTRPAEEIPLDD
jgi:benzoate transport